MSLKHLSSFQAYVCVHEIRHITEFLSGDLRTLVHHNLFVLLILINPQFEYQLHNHDFVSDYVRNFSLGNSEKPRFCCLTQDIDHKNGENIYGAHTHKLCVHEYMYGILVDSQVLSRTPQSGNIPFILEGTPFRLISLICAG